MPLDQAAMGYKPRRFPLQSASVSPQFWARQGKPLRTPNPDEISGFRLPDDELMVCSEAAEQHAILGPRCRVPSTSPVGM